MSFASLGLSTSIVKAVSELGYSEPTLIQKKAISKVLLGRDLIALAKRSTGKTAN